ncbi:MAG: hypothetical protein Q9157_009226, partial [Trypethelium eluteriae]
MVKIQAATLSNQIVRKPKRKRGAEDSNVQPQQHEEVAGTSPTPSVPSASASSPPPNTTTTIPTKTHDGGPKPQRRKAATKNGSDPPPPLRRNSSTTIIESSQPWPPHFTQLAATHRALNLVYTFCCTRKHLATTFDNLRSTVEGHIRRPLEIEE